MKAESSAGLFVSSSADAAGPALTTGEKGSVPYGVGIDTARPLGWVIQAACQNMAEQGARWAGYFGQNEAVVIARTRAKSKSRAVCGVAPQQDGHSRRGSAPHRSCG